MIRFKSIGAGLALAFSLAAQAQSANSPNGASGKQLALQTCTACHTVSADQSHKPALEPEAPSFLSIANDPGVTAPVVSAFLLTNHRSLKTPPDMPAMILSEPEANDLAAYIMSLRKVP